MNDARFEDADRPLRLRAESREDLEVISTLLQDSVGRVADAVFLRRKRRFAALLNRFRWEDVEQAQTARRPFERVRATLAVENVLSAKARGVKLDDPETVINILSIGFEPGEDGAGVIRLALSGGGDIALEVEAIEALLVDVARPHEARGLPRHKD